MEQKIDILHREPFIDKLVNLVEIMSAGKKNCCFGLNGAWGSGKTFVIEKFIDRLKEIKTEESSDSKYFVFNYDCWKYDYYDEPIIAIVSSMMDCVKEEISFLSRTENKYIVAGLDKAKEHLVKIAGEICKNKIGIDLVELAKEIHEDVKEEQEKETEFDELYAFKRTLENMRESIAEIAKEKTIVLVVDELDRCLPTYSIKVLERLHHIFNDLDNVIVMVSMDKRQLEHSIKGIYGEGTDVDAYLRKFISFKMDLDNGMADGYAAKFSSYFSMFDCSQEGVESVEQFLTDILMGLDMRTQEKIFRKAEIIHRLISDGRSTDVSILTFEILYLTVALREKSKDLKWLSTIWKADYVNHRDVLGDEYYNKLNEYGKQVRTQGTAYINGRDRSYIYDTMVGKTFFWLANVYNPYNKCTCGEYCYAIESENEVELVHKFTELIDVIDCD